MSLFLLGGNLGLQRAAELLSIKADGEQAASSSSGSSSSAAAINIGD